MLKRLCLAVAGLTALVAGGVAQAQPAPAKAAPVAAASPLADEKARASYAIGLNLGKSIGKDGVEFDPAMLARGLDDSRSGAKPLMTEAEVRATLARLQQTVAAARAAKAVQAAAANEAAGAAFLKANGAKPGVITLPSGLQYRVLTAGKGPAPKADDTVSCNYRGTLIDGTEFDSSYSRGEPLTIEVGGVIKGWTQALQLMPVGSKWRLFVPSDLAYGAQGAGENIGPNSTLIFEIELLSIQPKG